MYVSPCPRQLLGMSDARTSNSDADALDLAKNSPVMRLSSSPPMPSLRENLGAAKTLVGVGSADGDAEYQCFSDYKVSEGGDWRARP